MKPLGCASAGILKYARVDVNDERGGRWLVVGRRSSCCFIPVISLCSCARCEGEGRMTRELELSLRQGSDLVSFVYLLELAHSKRIEAGIGAAQAAEKSGDGIFVESIEKRCK